MLSVTAPEQIINYLRQAEVLLAQGTPPDQIETTSCYHYNAI
jgi:hypothetical protein